jgi:hypothetical protein
MWKVKNVLNMIVYNNLNMLLFFIRVIENKELLKPLEFYKDDHTVMIGQLININNGLIICLF